MKYLRLLLGLSIMLMLTCCTTSKSTISSSANLENYRYVSIVNNDSYHIPAELMEYQIQLFDAVEKSGLELVGDMNVYNLTLTQQSELLLAQYGVRITDSETIVTVNFIDFKTGRPIVSCRGVGSTLGIDSSYDMNKAISNVGKQISQTFGTK